MELERERRGDVTVLTLRGDFDRQSVPDVAPDIEQSLSRGEVRLIADIHGVTFMDSSVIAYLLRIRKRVLDEGGMLVLVQPNDIVRRSLRTLGIESMFPLCDDMDSGMAHFADG